jgi:hypothetical protein
MRGRTISLSLERRLVADLMRFAMDVPTCTEAQSMNLAAVAAARAQYATRPRWITIFIKAYALVAREIPELRRVYLPYPEPHFYEYPASVALIFVRREFRGEKFHIGFTIKDPASLPLIEIDNRITAAAELPPEQIKEYRQMVTFGRLPSPLRRMMAWLGYNIGRQRPKYFGTFAVTTPPEGRIAGWLSAWTSRVSYGRLASDGTVAVNVSVDHRVVDGPTGAYVLTRLEQVLGGAIVEELRAGKPA